MMCGIDRFQCRIRLNNGQEVTEDERRIDGTPTEEVQRIKLVDRENNEAVVVLVPPKLARLVLFRRRVHKATEDAQQGPAPVLVLGWTFLGDDQSVLAERDQIDSSLCFVNDKGRIAFASSPYAIWREEHFA